MNFGTALVADFNSLINAYGVLVKFTYFNVTFAGAGSGYDDDVSLAKSGVDVWTSGMIFPLTAGAGNISYDGLLMQQGKVLMNDSKLFVPGVVNTSGIFKVQVGSPSGRVFSTIDTGETAYQVEGTLIYKKLYVRVLTNGSIGA